MNGDTMIDPYGSKELNPLYVADDDQRAQLLAEAECLPSLTISSGSAAAAVMLGSGYFNPLPGYMDLEEALGVAARMRLANGMLWPVPVVNIVPRERIPPAVGPGSRVALLDPNLENNPVIAIQELRSIEPLSEGDVACLVEQTFGTTDSRHPGVAAFMAMGDAVLAGPIQVLSHSYFRADFPDTFRTAPELRREFAARGWNTVVAFQTRNPMHRAHEELCRMAWKSAGADGILIHMLLGRLKPGDIPARVRDAAIRKMVDLYFPANTVYIAGYGFDMLYAGPREAVLHAIFRQNSGCTHLIVGRDHAGIGDYYDPFAAQTIFDRIPEGSLDIEIFRGDHTVWCNECGAIVMMRDCPHDKGSHLFLSGTQVRRMLAAGQPLPPQFARPEVAEILMRYYREEESP